MYYEFYCKHCNLTYLGLSLEDRICPICGNESDVVRIEYSESNYPQNIAED